MKENLNLQEIREFLEEKVNLYNNPGFIENDPVSVPHRYTLKEDIEIAGFLAATISWGNRKSIVGNAHRMMDLMGNSPYDFVMSHSTAQLKKMDSFAHRTFNAVDLVYCTKALKNVYKKQGGMEKIFSIYATPVSLQHAIHEFKKVFFELPHQERTTKHLADPLRGSAAKRINMFLRWMVRRDHRGVDFGIWKSINPSSLSCPLDVHSGTVARKLGILSRKQNDARAVTELDEKLREFDSRDPVKYDFALFGLGIIEKF